METSEPPELNLHLNADAQWNFDLNVPLDFRYLDEALDLDLDIWDAILIPLPDRDVDTVSILLDYVADSKPIALNVISRSSYLCNPCDYDLWSYGEAIDMLVEKIADLLIPPDVKLDFQKLDIPPDLTEKKKKSLATLKHSTGLNKFVVFNHNHLLLQILRVYHLQQLLFHKFIFFCLLFCTYLEMLPLFYWLQAQYLKIWRSVDHTRCVINTCARFTHHDECWGFTSAGEWLRTRCTHYLTPTGVCSVLL